ncbi:MerR family transcriptional regulator [Paenibacillus sp. Marseille-Q4541]|uniref:MerR family transcriptional regulator n=1 Tax=Paenibacillus sp. Marseille-Q4541 TaxID=2831522 RepID=UPI001BAB10A7|nr:MerR family transcriptional regulator [Paenibacillus sp. Marseille-Q4541]
MNDIARKYFTTGEFAKLCNVKKQTLFHYDDIGLLSPEIKTENGYRYYSYHQFDIFHVIELLKEVDMPLKEIKRFFENKTPQELIDLLKSKSLEMEKKIHDLRQLQKIIETKISITESALSADITKITMTHQEEELLFLSESILDCSDREFLKSVAVFIDYLYTNELDTGYPIGAMVSRDNIMKEDYGNYTFLYNKTAKHMKGVPYHIKPKGNYIVAYHKGSDEHIAQTYQRMQSYIREHGIHIGNYSYEEYILDEISVSGNENYVTQIMIEVVENEEVSS